MKIEFLQRECRKLNYLFFRNVKIYLLLSLTIVMLISGCSKDMQKHDSENNIIIDTTKNVASIDEFTIAVLPDAQYYTAVRYGGNMTMFNSQIDWIRSNAISNKIAFVIQLGDISDNGDDVPGQWINAKTTMYKLEASLTGYPEGIPYGVAVGNHEQTPNGDAYGTTDQYNTYFGVAHFTGKSYFGGAYSTKTDNHYNLFSANGINFIVIYLEYKKGAIGGALTWASDLLDQYASRKAIIVTHYTLTNNGTPGTNNGTPGAFSAQALLIYNQIKSKTNVFMMLGGHIGDNGEGYRQDIYNGHTIRSFLSDYQSRTNSVGIRNGGNGMMRLMKINTATDKISISTFTPYTTPDSYENDGDSRFTVPLFQ